MKFNAIQHWLLSSGLEQQRAAMKAEVQRAEAKGGNAIMTQGYVDHIIDDALEQLNANTSKKVLKELAKNQ